jgi:hypothetical protein
LIVVGGRWFTVGIEIYEVDLLLVFLRAITGEVSNFSTLEAGVVSLVRFGRIGSSSSSAELIPSASPIVGSSGSTKVHGDRSIGHPSRGVRRVVWVFRPSLRPVVESILALLSHPIEVKGARPLVIRSVPRFSLAFLCGPLGSEHILYDSLRCSGFDGSLFDCRISMNCWRV